MFTVLPLQIPQITKQNVLNLQKIINYPIPNTLQTPNSDIYMERVSGREESHNIVLCPTLSFKFIVGTCRVFFLSLCYF